MRNETPAVINTVPAASCGPASVILSAEGDIPGSDTSPDILWYNLESGGTPLFTGPDFTTPELQATTTYWVEATANGCTSPRVAVEATISPVVTAGSLTNPTTSACSDPNNGPATLDLDDRIQGADPGEWSFVNGPETVSIEP